MIVRHLQSHQVRLANIRMYVIAATSSAPTNPQQTQYNQAQDPYQAEIMRRAQFMHRNQAVFPVSQQDILQHKPHRVRQIESAEQKARKHRGILMTLGVSLLSTPVIIWYYWQHREQHMREKKARLLKEAQERYKRYG